MKKHIQSILKKTQAIKEKMQKFAEITAEKEESAKKIEAPVIEKKDKVVVEFSLTSVTKATLLIMFLLFLSTMLSEMSDILILIFVAIFLSAALDPTVDKLQAKGIPRGLGILLIYFTVAVFLFIFISQLIPLLATQISELADKLVVYAKNITSMDPSKIPFGDKLMPFINNFLDTVDEDTLLQNLQTGLKGLAVQLKSVAGNTWTALAVIFSSILNAVLVLILTFFMVIEEDSIEKFLRSLFPSKYSQYIVAKTSEIKDKVGNWLRGQIILSITMGIITGIGFAIMGVEYAVTLGMVAALAEFLPMIGPSITFLSGALIASNQSAWLVLGVAIWCIVMQIIEGNVLIPMIMRRAVGLSPVIVIISMMFGFKMLGILGIIISLPVATVIGIFIEDYAKKTK